MSGSVADVLLEIVARRRERLGVEVSRAFGALKASRTSQTSLNTAENPFLAALEARRGRAVIAEIKMGSPRIGRLEGRIDPELQARLYRDGGAAALSVVVEPDFFHGSYELLARCRKISGLPAIAKDFVVDSSQLRWAREAGAEAILLIAALYEREELAGYAAEARALGLVPLVETHDAADLAKLTGGEWELLGVNNRDLRTFDVDLERSIECVAELPAAALKVAESGIESRADLDRLAAAGFDAFLIGESLLLADDPAARLAELVG
ncbi:MAG: indole-3-glycerol-phosphate synthase [Acidobacteriota bacterium]|nr:indole-3-glycerol-phosphate synthase [Acidobacteriota bacterium]